MKDFPYLSFIYINKKAKHSQICIMLKAEFGLTLVICFGGNGSLFLLKGRNL
jgi:hypothetical protein